MTVLVLTELGTAKYAGTFSSLNYLTESYLVVPGAEKNGFRFLAVMKYDGNAFGGFRYCKIWWLCSDTGKMKVTIEVVPDTGKMALCFL